MASLDNTLGAFTLGGGAGRVIAAQRVDPQPPVVDDLLGHPPLWVYDTESGDTPVRIGRYVRTEEDAVIYVDRCGIVHQAPVDCVLVAP